MYKYWIIVLMLLPSMAMGQFFQSGGDGGANDSIGIDADDNGTFESYLYPAFLQKGTNITFTVAGDTLTIAGPVGSGTVDTFYFGYRDSWGSEAWLTSGDTIWIDTTSVSDSAQIAENAIRSYHIDNTTIRMVDLNSISLDSADFYIFGASLGDFYGQNTAELHLVLDTGDTITGTLTVTGYIAMEDKDIENVNQIDADTVTIDNHLQIGGEDYDKLNGLGLTVTSGDLEVQADIRNHTLDSAEVVTIVTDSGFVEDTDVYGFAGTPSPDSFDLIRINGDDSLVFLPLIDMIMGRYADTTGKDSLKITYADTAGYALAGVGGSTNADSLRGIVISSVTPTQGYVLKADTTGTDSLYWAAETGSTNADSIRGTYVNSVPADNGYIMKYYLTGDTIGWAAETGGAGTGDTLILVDSAGTEYSIISNRVKLKQGSAIVFHRNDSTSFDEIKINIDPDSFFTTAELTTFIDTTLGGTSTRLDDYVLKVDVTPDPDSFYWSAGGAGETNTISDTGTFNGTEGFGLAGGKTGVSLKVKGLIEGANITMTASGDSAYTIAATGGSGETNTASNRGITADSIFYQKTGVDLEFRRLIGAGEVTVAASGDTALSITGSAHTVLNDSLLGTGEAAAIYETITNVGLIGDDTTAVLAAKDTVAAWDNGAYPLDDTLLGTNEAAGTYETIANVGLIGDDTTAMLAAKDSVAAWDNGAYPGLGETNTLSDTGTFNGTEGFGLAGGKTGTALKVKGLIEGSNITIAASGDSAYTITGAAGGSGTTDSTYINDGTQYGPFTNDMFKIKEGSLIDIVRDDSTSYDVFNIGIETDSFYTTEDLEDTVGAMFTGNTETAITIDYQDGDGTIDAIVDVASDGGLVVTDDSLEVKLDGSTLAKGASGLKVSAVSTTEITDQTITGADVDSTSANFIFNDAYRITSAEADSAFPTKGYIDNTFETITNVALIGDDTTDWLAIEESVYVWDNGNFPLGDDKVQDQHIDWGSGASQVDLADIPGGTAGASAFDFGGAASLEIPSVDNPTTNAEGQIAWDANDDAIEVYSGDESESGLIPFYKKFAVLISQPDSIQAYSDSLPIFHANALMFPAGIEIDLVSITLEADAAYSVVLQEWNNADPPVYQNVITTIATGATDSYAEEVPDTDGNLTVGERIYLVLPTTDVPSVFIEVYYHVTAN